MQKKTWRWMGVLKKLFLQLLIYSGNQLQLVSLDTHMSTMQLYSISWNYYDFVSFIVISSIR